MGAGGVEVPPAPTASGQRRAADAPASVAEDGAALVLRLIRAVARAERRTGEASDERSLTCPCTAISDRATGSPEPGADEAAERTRLRDAKRAFAARGAVRGNGRRRGCP